MFVTLCGFLDCDPKILEKKNDNDDFSCMFTLRAYQTNTSTSINIVRCVCVGKIATKVFENLKKDDYISVSAKLRINEKNECSLFVYDYLLMLEKRIVPNYN